MLSLETIPDLVGRGAALYQNFIPPEWVPYPNLTALGVIGVGILLAFWGTRLLRTIYVLGFMVAGAAQGFKIGSTLGIDTLIGLTFGAGIAALLAYAFFRWWVGLTAGAVAVLLVLALAWPKLADMQTQYQDHLLGMGSEPQLTSGQEPHSVQEFAVGFSEYLWTQQRDFAWRFVLAAGAACVLGMVLGLMLPRFTTVLGTSMLGMVLVSSGVGVFMWMNWKDTWTRVASHPDWYLVGMGAFLIVSAWRQTRSGKAPAAAPAPAPPPADTPAPQGKS